MNYIYERRCCGSHISVSDEFLVLFPLLPSGKTQLMERDALGVVGQAGFARNK